MLLYDRRPLQEGIRPSRKVPTSLHRPQCCERAEDQILGRLYHLRAVAIQRLRLEVEMLPRAPTPLRFPGAAVIHCPAVFRHCPTCRFLLREDAVRKLIETSR